MQKATEIFWKGSLHESCRIWMVYVTHMNESCHTHECRNRLRRLKKLFTSTKRAQVYTCVSARALMRVCVCVCVHACVRACVRACMHACVHACMRVCAAVCNYTHTHTHIHVHIHTHTYNTKLQAELRGIPCAYRVSTVCLPCAYCVSILIMYIRTLPHTLSHIPPPALPLSLSVFLCLSLSWFQNCTRTHDQTHTHTHTYTHAHTHIANTYML